MSRSAVLTTGGPSAGGLAAGALTVTFQRAADRYAHSIAWQTPTGPLVLVESIEGTDLDVWPASAALQDIHLEDRPGGVQLALLVGKAGRSHWSLSCEVAPHGQITFDFACRLHERPTWLGSSYRVANPPFDSGPNGKIVWQHGDARCELRTELSIKHGDENQLALSAPHLTAPLPATLQWKYVFAVRQ